VKQTAKHFNLSPNTLETGANAGSSLFLAAYGFFDNGPASWLGFDPKIGPEDFNASFITAEE
jgi:hypothetical protein